MLTKITDSKLLTEADARALYPDSIIFYRKEPYTKKHRDTDTILVLYIADDVVDFSRIPQEEKMYNGCGWCEGDNLLKRVEIGGVEYWPNLN